MDQPYSRIADALLDRQYWAPDDPQKHPYDDTGWSFPDLFDVPVAAGDGRVDFEGKDGGGGRSRCCEWGGRAGRATWWRWTIPARLSLLELRYALKDAKISVAEAGFDAGREAFWGGVADYSRTPAADAVKAAIQDADVEAVSLGAAPSVAMHDAPAPRIAMMHTWGGTQTEGWWREALDKLHVPYDYISRRRCRTRAICGRSTT